MKAIKQTIIIAFLCSLLTGTIVWYVFATSGGGGFTISPGIYPGNDDYTIWTDGTNYYSKGKTGAYLAGFESGSTNATELITASLGALPVMARSYPSMATPKKSGSLYLTTGNYSLTAPVIINSSFQNVRIRMSPRAFILIENDKAGFWVDNEDVSGAIFDGGVFYGVTGHTGYGIRLDGGSAHYITNCFGWFLKNYFIFLNATVYSLNYLHITSIGTGSCDGTLYALGEAEGTSISLNAVDWTVTTDLNDLAAILIQGIYDASFTAIVGESTGDFFRMQGTAGGMWFEQCSATSTTGAAYGMYYLDGYQPNFVQFINCFSYDSYNFMYINATRVSVVNCNSHYSYRDGVVIAHGATAIYFNGGMLWDCNKGGGTYYDFNVTTANKVQVIGMVLESTNATKCFSLPAVNDAWVYHSHMVSPGGTWTNAPAHSGDNDT